MLQVGQQCGNGLIRFGRKGAVVIPNADVPIPAFLILGATAVELDEADPAFNQSPGVQALPGKMLAALIVNAVEFLDRLWLAFQIESLRSRSLHAVSEFKTFDARLQVGGPVSSLLMFAVEEPDQIELSSLLRLSHARGSNKIIDRRAFIVKCRTLTHSGEKTSPPILSLSLWESATERIRHHHKRREITVFATHAIGRPGSNTRVAHTAFAGIQGEQGGRMIIRLAEA